MSEYEELSPNYKKALMASANVPFWSLLGIKLVEIRKGWAQIKLPFSKKLDNALGIAHGGAVFALADSAVAMALLGLLDRGESPSTIEMKINYLKPFSSGEIIAEAVIIHRGATTALGEVEVRDENNQLIAKGLATYMITKRKRADEKIG